MGLRSSSKASGTEPEASRLRGRWVVRLGAQGLVDVVRMRPIVVVALMPSLVLAQETNLPAPAPLEWYVQMGVYKPLVDGKEIPRLPEQECTAMVLANREGNSLGIQPSKVAGPYRTQQAAEAALRKAGWKYFRSFIGIKGSIWHARTGC